MENYNGVKITKISCPLKGSLISDDIFTSGWKDENSYFTHFEDGNKVKKTLSEIDQLLKRLKRHFECYQPLNRSKIFW